MSERPDKIWAMPSLGLPDGGFWSEDGPRHHLSREYLLATPAREAAGELLEALRVFAAFGLPEDDDGTPDDRISGQALAYVIRQDDIRAARTAVAKASARGTV